MAGRYSDNPHEPQEECIWFHIKVWVYVKQSYLEITRRSAIISWPFCVLFIVSSMIITVVVCCLTTEKFRDSELGYLAWVAILISSFLTTLGFYAFAHPEISQAISRNYYDELRKIRKESDL